MKASTIIINKNILTNGYSGLCVYCLSVLGRVNGLDPCPSIAVGGLGSLVDCVFYASTPPLQNSLLVIEILNERSLFSMEDGADMAPI